MTTIDITPLQDRYILDGWDKLVSFEDFLSIKAQQGIFESNEKGYQVYSTR